MKGCDLCPRHTGRDTTRAISLLCPGNRKICLIPAGSLLPHQLKYLILGNMTLHTPGCVEKLTKNELISQKDTCVFLFHRS